MKKVSIALLIILSILLISCNEDRTSSNNNNLSDRIEALEVKIHKLEKSIQDINDKIILDSEVGDDSDDRNINKLEALLHIVENLSDVHIKEGYILDYISDDKHFIIDYADLIKDSNDRLRKNKS